MIQIPLSTHVFLSLPYYNQPSYSLYVSSYICETTHYCKAEDDNANEKKEERYDSIWDTKSGPSTFSFVTLIQLHSILDTIGRDNRQRRRVYSQPIVSYIKNYRRHLLLCCHFSHLHYPFLFIRLFYFILTFIHTHIYVWHVLWQHLLH